MKHFTWQIFTASAKMFSFGDQTIVMVKRASGPWHSMMARKCCLTPPNDHLALVHYQSLQNDFFCPCNHSFSLASRWSTSTPSDGWDKYFDLDHLSSTASWIVRHSYLLGVKISNGAFLMILLLLNKTNRKLEHLIIIKNIQTATKEMSVILKMIGMTVLLISAALDRNKCTAPQPLQGLTHGTGPQKDWQQNKRLHFLTPVPT